MLTSKQKKILFRYYNKLTPWYLSKANSNNRIEGYRFCRSYNQQDNFFLKKLGLKPNKTYNILDMGCGVGEPSLSFLKKLKASYFHLVNINPKHISLIPKHSNITTYCQDFHDVSFNKNTFDVVYFFESLCHSPRKEYVLKKVYDILKPGGKLLIMDLFAIDEAYIGNREYAISLGIYLDTCKRLISTLLKIGFKIDFFEKEKLNFFSTFLSEKYKPVNYMLYKNNKISDFGKIHKSLFKLKKSIIEYNIIIGKK